MSYESAAEPIKIGYLMDFLLSDDYPQDRRDNLTGHRCLRRTGGRRLPCHLRARHRRQRRSNTRSDRHQSVVRKLDSAGMDGCGHLVARRLDAEGVNSHLVDRFGEE
jgi:hypothetical protein